jgi:hypothetical protein
MIHVDDNIEIISLSLQTKEENPYSTTLSYEGTYDRVVCG